MSVELTELKYQEILEYQELVSNTAIYSNIASADNMQIGCLCTAIMISLIMGCCAMVFTPAPKPKNRR